MVTEAEWRNGGMVEWRNGAMVECQWKVGCLAFHKATSHRKISTLRSIFFYFFCFLFFKIFILLLNCNKCCTSLRLPAEGERGDLDTLTELLPYAHCVEVCPLPEQFYA